MATYKTPGVYIQEESSFGPAIVGADIGLPAFIGYTQITRWEDNNFLFRPVLVESFNDYQKHFGIAQTASLQFSLTAEKQLDGAVSLVPAAFNLYHSIRLYFYNGGGKCFIISTGDYKAGITATVSERYLHHQQALESAASIAAISLLVFPDAPSLVNLPTDPQMPVVENYMGSIYKDGLAQCDRLKNRFLIADVFERPGISYYQALEAFREGIGTDHLQFGAAYSPYLKTQLSHYLDENDHAALLISGPGIPAGICLNKTNAAVRDPYSLAHSNPAVYRLLLDKINASTLVLPPSSGIAGIYCSNDISRGIWKAPANIAVNGALDVTVKITNEVQDGMNITASGKSINAIRNFDGKGVIVWGARTLTGNDHEFRYVPVKRFCMMVQTAIDFGMQPFIFEPNDANTWVKLKVLVENFLSKLWRDGALMGAKPDESYFVHVGLNTSMTSLDILEGRLILEIGMAVLRPAEFIILRFTMKMQAQ